MCCSQWERTSFSAVAAPAIDLNAQTMDCSIWLPFIRLVTKPRLSEQSAVCTRTQTCILSNRRNTFFDHHFRLAPLCGHDEYHQTISSRSGLLHLPVCCIYFLSSGCLGNSKNFIKSLPSSTKAKQLRKLRNWRDLTAAECHFRYKTALVCAFKRD